MNPMLKFPFVTALVVASTLPAAALEVTKSATIGAPAAVVWKTIGQFCGIGDWHPAIEKCAPSTQDGKPVRTLSLKGGGTIIEQQQARDETKMDYTYTILESPLPVSDYRSTIMVTPNGAGSKVTWTGTFKAKGAPDAKAEEVIGGIYEAGFKGLSAKLK
jgi:Polyketide cyclase / dehydrase and lipid transport